MIYGDRKSDQTTKKIYGQPTGLNRPIQLTGANYETLIEISDYIFT